MTYRLVMLDLHVRDAGRNAESHSVPAPAPAPGGQPGKGTKRDRPSQPARSLADVHQPSVPPVAAKGLPLLMHAQSPNGDCSNSLRTPIMVCDVHACLPSMKQHIKAGDTHEP